MARSSLGIGMAGLLLIVGGAIFGLWAWVFTEPASAVSADCERLEAEAPEFGEDLRALQTAVGDLNEMADSIERAGEHFRALGGELDDEEFGNALIEGGAAAEKAVERLRAGDLAGGVAALPKLMALVEKAYTFLNDNCPNWEGPGQWTSPGETAPTGGPGDLPSIPELPELPELPSGFPSLPELPSLPSGFPSLPELPELPSFPAPSGQ